MAQRGAQHKHGFLRQHKDAPPAVAGDEHPAVVLDDKLRHTHVVALQQAGAAAVVRGTAPGAVHVVAAQRVQAFGQAPLVVDDHDFAVGAQRKGVGPVVGFVHARGHAARVDACAQKARDGAAQDGVSH
jgi:hypothetical protein